MSTVSSGSHATFTPFNVTGINVKTDLKQVAPQAKINNILP